MVSYKYALLAWMAFLSWDVEAISCDEYKKNINNRTVVPRESEWDQAWCEQLPEKCGESWLFFNPKGMTTFYYKSHCFFTIAIKKVNERLCDRVTERTSWWQDGSYYSPANCLREVMKKKRWTAGKDSPTAHVQRLQNISLRSTPSAAIVATLSGGISGIYAVRLVAEIGRSDRSPPTDIVLVNLDQKQAPFSRAYQHLGLGNIQLLDLNAHQRKIELNLDESTMRPLRDAIKQGKSLVFIFELTFLEGPGGRVANPNTIYELTSRAKLSVTNSPKR